MRSKLFAQLLVPGLAVLTTVLGVGSSASAATAVCKAPKPWQPPASSTVVGKGTAKSCTQRALRSAVAAGGHVTFKCGGKAVTIPVTSEMKVAKTTVIDGAGKVTFKGAGKNRLLVVGAAGVRLSVRNLRLVNGAAAKATKDKNDRGKGGAIAGGWRTYVEVIGSTFEGNSAGAGGGAIYVGTDSTLSIVRSVFRSNSTGSFGGAVFSMLSPLTVIDSTFTKNSSRGGGGAIGTDGASAPERRNGEIRICGSVFDRNTGGDTGGAAFLWTYAPERIIVDRTTFKKNKAGGFAGAARLSTGTTPGKKGSITIRSSNFLSNSSKSNGGALYVDCAPTCAINDSTFYRNSSGSYGGAIFGDRHTDNNVTFAQNTAGGHGGALFGSKYVLNNTVFVGNAARNPWGQAMSCSSTGTGRKVMQWLSSSRDGSTKCISGVIAKNPRLAAPANNGGPTLTMMPAANSPVLQAGSGCTSQDQRGASRKKSACDLGAVERTAAAAAAGMTSATSAPTAPSAAGEPAPAPPAEAGPSTSPPPALRAVNASAPWHPLPMTGIVLTALVGAGVIFTATLLVTRAARRSRAGARRACSD